ncbi:MAG: carboxypeptidase-like regulatory domain-containing protein [bacterium]
MRVLIALLLAGGMLVSCGNGDKTASGSSDSRLVPAAVEQLAPGSEIFLAGLPEEGSFNPVRVPAVSSLSIPGSRFDSASANVSAADELAQFSPAGSLEYAIWRFEGTPQDSLGSISLAFAGAEPGSSCWVAVADYSTGCWDWLGHAANGAAFADELGGSPGQHSSPAGYIYVAALADSPADFSIGSVTIEYLLRHDVSGLVLDMAGKPLPGVLLTTNLSDPQAVYSAADGSFSLSAIPDGNWAVMAALDGWQFQPAITNVTVNGAAVNDLVLRGFRTNSGLVADDQTEPNNYPANAHDIGAGPLAGESLGILDDPVDYYRFDVPAEGWYYIQFVGDESILFPTLNLYNDAVIYIDSGSVVSSGANWLGHYFPAAGSYITGVKCEGGAGHYSLSLHSGRTAELRCDFTDSGAAGDGDDGLQEELHIAQLKLEVDGQLARIPVYFLNIAIHGHIPPLPATLTPEAALYQFEPASLQHDFSSGNLTDADFNFVASAPLDEMEPNNDKADATPLSLPLSAPIQGWIGGEELTGNDDRDLFSFTAEEGRHVMVRVSYPDHGNNLANLGSSLNLRDAADGTVPMHLMSDFNLQQRSISPLAAGTYYLDLYSPGTLLRYELFVQEFDPVFLSADYQLEGSGLRNCLLQLGFGDGDWLEQELSGSTGLAEIDLPLIPGENVFVQHSRFGMEFSPAGEWIEVPDNDLLLEPEISLAGDALEPNDASSTAAPIVFGQQMHATLGVTTDSLDTYLLDVEDPVELEFVLELSDQDAAAEMLLLRTSGPPESYSHKARGDRTIYYRVSTPGQYELRIDTENSAEISYDLLIDKAQVPVYSISGTVDNGVAGEFNSGSFIINHTTGDYRAPGSATYLLGYYPDGTYGIEWQISNRVVTPPGITDVVINGADAVLDFSAVYLDQDFGEPNDSSLDATLLSLPALHLATLDDNNPLYPSGRDSYDWYRFVAPADGHFEVRLLPWRNEIGNFNVQLSEDSWPNVVGTGRLFPPDGSLFMRRNLVSGKTYFIRVQSFEDLLYQLEAEYIP